MSAPKNPSAFPSPTTYYRDGEIRDHAIPGLTMRDYAMIHAPVAEIEAIIPDTIAEIKEWLGLDEAYTYQKHYVLAVIKARGIWADEMLKAWLEKEAK